jgi:hypothetical protein
MNNIEYLWTSDDYQHHLCRADQIGTPKPTSKALQTGTSEGPKKTYAEKLQQLSESAVDAVLDHPGGATKWFKDNPQAHVKVLVKLATPQVAAQDVNLSVEVSWLSPERLSYRGGQNVVDISGPIEDAKVLEALSPESTGQWKPVEPEITGINSLIHGIKGPN